MTLEAADTTFLLDPETRVFAHGPAARNLPNLFRNLRLAWTIVRRYKPDVILSTGAALAVPFFLVGRVLGVRLVYVESFTRVHRPALTGRLVYPLTDVFFVQWPSYPPPQARHLCLQCRVTVHRRSLEPIRVRSHDDAGGWQAGG